MSEIKISKEINALKFKQKGRFLMNDSKNLIHLPLKSPQWILHKEWMSQLASTEVCRWQHRTHYFQEVDTRFNRCKNVDFTQEHGHPGFHVQWHNEIASTILLSLQWIKSNVSQDDDLGFYLNGTILL